MLKIREIATLINKDGGKDLRALLGAVIGAGLAYWALSLSSAASHIGTIIVVAVAFGATLGAIVGIVLCRLIDLRLAPKVEQTIQDSADKASERPRHGSKT